VAAAPPSASCPPDTGGSVGTPAPASNTSTNYLALGDALTVDYQPGHGEDRTGGFVGAVLQDWRCRHPTAQLTNLACVEESTSGAVTGGGSGCHYPEGSQLAAALATLRNGGAGLVTVTLGLEDASRCTHAAGIDQSCVANLLSTVEKNLTSMLTQIRAAAPSARIVILNLYNPLLANAGDPDAASTQPPQPASPQLATQSSDMFAQLNRTLATVAAKTGARVADVSGAFAATDTTGSPIPVNVQRLCDWTWQCRTGQGIPNDAGYAAIAHAVIATL
jgi:lysophospholipase L1-like esterase